MDLASLAAVIEEMEPSVLIVEDEPCIRDVLTELFDVPGVVVHAAGTLDEARQRLAERCYRLILTDIRLGAHTDGGLQVMAVAGLLSPSAMVIALTAFPSDVTSAAAERLGARQFIQKPVSLERIAELAGHAGVPTAVSLVELSLVSNGEMAQAM